MLATLPPQVNLAAQAYSYDIWQLVVGITLAYSLSYILGKVYVKYSDSLSNRYAFSRLFPLISSATCLIIFVVKSSLALSLGLVGALSIVRFRTAIKDPEELIFLFVSIAFGLAAGAGQYFAAIVGFAMIALGSYFLKTRRNISTSNNLFRLTVESFDYGEISSLINILKNNVERVDLGNLISSNNSSNLCSMNLSISINDVTDLMNLKNELSSRFPEVKFNFIETKTI